VSRTVDPRVWGWFDKGEIIPALRGHDDYFIPGPTWRERHDELLVLRQLVLWADDRDEWPIALRAVETALRLTIEAGDEPDALGLAWAAVLVGDNMHETLLTEEAMSLVRDISAVSDCSPETRAVAEALIERLGPRSE